MREKKKKKKEDEDEDEENEEEEEEEEEKRKKKIGWRSIVVDISLTGGDLSRHNACIYRPVSINGHVAPLLCNIATVPVVDDVRMPPIGNPWATHARVRALAHIRRQPERRC